MTSVAESLASRAWDHKRNGVSNYLVEVTKEKHIVFMGGSVTRSCYKDFIKTLRDGRITCQQDLRNKGELTFEDDERIVCNKETYRQDKVDYIEVRKYTKCNHQVTFYFITQAYGDYTEEIIAELNEATKTPDVIILTSDVWDIVTRKQELNDYKGDLEKALSRITECFPTCEVIWRCSSPAFGKQVKGGIFTDVEEEYSPEEIEQRMKEAKAIAREITSRLEVKFMDNWIILEKLQHLRARDGIHWDTYAHRIMTCNLLLLMSCRSSGKEVVKKAKKRLIDTLETNEVCDAFQTLRFVSRSFQKELPLKQRILELIEDLNTTLKDRDKISITDEDIIDAYQLSSRKAMIVRFSSTQLRMNILRRRADVTSITLTKDSCEPVYINENLNSEESRLLNDARSLLYDLDKSQFYYSIMSYRHIICATVDIRSKGAHKRMAIAPLFYMEITDRDGLKTLQDVVRNEISQLSIPENPRDEETDDLYDMFLFKDFQYDEVDDDNYLKTRQKKARQDKKPKRRQRKDGRDDVHIPRRRKKKYKKCFYDD